MTICRASVSDTTMQADVASENCGLLTAPIASQKGFAFARSRTGGFTKIILLMTPFSSRLGGLENGCAKGLRTLPPNENMPSSGLLKKSDSRADDIGIETSPSGLEARQRPDPLRRQRPLRSGLARFSRLNLICYGKPTHARRPTRVQGGD